MILSFLSKTHHARIAISVLLLLLTNVAYAGGDWTRYDDAPTCANIAAYSAKLSSLPVLPTLKDCLKQETDCWNKLQASLNKFDASVLWS